LNLAAIAHAATWTAPLRAQSSPPASTISGRGTDLPPAPEYVSLGDVLGDGATERLLQSFDVEDRIRGLERLTPSPAPETLARLVRFKDDAIGSNGDPRLFLVLVRALARQVDRPVARAALLGIVRASAAPSAPSGPEMNPVASDRARTARWTLARRQAALALASSERPDAVRSLFDATRDGDADRVAAAVDALTAFPPEAIDTYPRTLSIAAIDVIGATGDLRMLPAVRAASASSDPVVRAKSLLVRATLGDVDSVGTAQSWRHDPDAGVRTAAAEVLVGFASPEAASAVGDLVGDDATVVDGLRLARRCASEEVTKALAARVIASAEPRERIAAATALGRQATPSSLRVLLSLTADPTLAGSAAEAIARSPNGGAMATIEALASRPDAERLALRAYLVRRFTRAERSDRLDDLAARLANSGDGRDRAVATQLRVALGEEPLDAALADADPRVRRAAALAVVANAGAENAERLLRRLLVERDETTRVLLAGALAQSREPSGLSSATLRAHLAAGDIAAPLAAFVLGRRADSAPDLHELFAAEDPVVRAALMRGLGANRAPNVPAELAAAYLWEPDLDVRRAAVFALAEGHAGGAHPAAREALELAAQLDPDPQNRAVAARSLAGAPVDSVSAIAEVAWLALVRAPDATLPREVAGLVVTRGGIPVPVVFDDDGFALLPGASPDGARLRLAAHLSSYSP
jgi:hypothetical protein